MRSMDSTSPRRTTMSRSEVRQRQPRRHPPMNPPEGDAASINITSPYEPPPPETSVTSSTIRRRRPNVIHNNDVAPLLTGAATSSMIRMRRPNMILSNAALQDTVSASPAPATSVSCTTNHELMANGILQADGPPSSTTVRRRISFPQRNAAADPTVQIIGTHKPEVVGLVVNDLGMSDKGRDLIVQDHASNPQRIKETHLLRKAG